MKEGFNTKKYLEAQEIKFEEALNHDPDKPVFIEFGGKPFSDHHAERVLPGYEADCKAEILRETIKLSEIVMVVNSLDILMQPDGRTLKGRIRGDTGLVYDKETIRMIENAHDHKIPIDKVVLAVTPGNVSLENKEIIDLFKTDLEKVGAKLLINYGIKNYPNPKIFESEKNPFEKNDRVRIGDGNLIVVSPGGGSGKFGVLLSEMYRALVEGQTPHYVKFETFPIYQLEAEHALNLAFEAATADLGNKVIDTRKEKNKEYRTSYDKDLENFELLTKLFETFGRTEELAHIKDAVDMGINRIIDGITDMDVIKEACHKEIVARILRYKKEAKNGIEEIKTVQMTEEILGKFTKIYQINSK